MSMMKTVLKAAIFSVLFLSGGNLAAQVSPVRLGVRLGGGMSVNTGMDKILVPEDYYSNYSFKDKWQLTPTVGVFAQYHVTGSIIGAEGGFSYWQQASRLAYNDNKGLDYCYDILENLLYFCKYNRCKRMFVV